MTTEPIVESGMTFGPYPEGCCFYIEKSKTYQKIKKDGVKIAEFLLLRSQDEPKVWIIEAKTGTPHPGNQPTFNDFIGEIREKFANTLILSIATCLKRHPTCEELPNFFKRLDLKEVSFRLVLVIKGHPEGWLPQLQDTLQKALKPTVKTWGLHSSSVVVLNEAMAKEKGLILM